jgi:hypothetical protein
VTEGDGTRFAALGSLRMPGRLLVRAAVGDPGTRRIIKRLEKSLG